MNEEKYSKELKWYELGIMHDAGKLSRIHFHVKWKLKEPLMYIFCSHWNTFNLYPHIQQKMIKTVSGFLQKFNSKVMTVQILGCRNLQEQFWIKQWFGLNVLIICWRTENLDQQKVRKLEKYGEGLVSETFEQSPMFSGC